MAIEKEQRPQMPKGQFLSIFLLMIAIFFILDARLRELAGRTVGIVLDPIIGFNKQQPILTILIAALLMVTISTLVRHFLVDWLKMARLQNTMRAYQKAMREARVKRDTRKVEQLQKMQPRLMSQQAELSSGQMKPMALTMLFVLPLFAWMWQFVTELPYPFFSAPWNPAVDMFGATVLPHWILFYTVISIPFGVMLQKALKYFEWRDRWHLIKAKQAGESVDATKR